MATVPTYRIKGWDNSGFEVSQNSRTRGPLKWVAVPTKHDGKGFRRLMGHKEGVAFFGCWCLLVQVAAKCPTRGVLADGDGPLSSSDLHLKTGAPADVLARALNYLHKEVGWLEVVGAEPFDTSQQNVAACNKVLPTYVTEQDVTEQDETKPAAADVVPLPASLEESERFRAAWADWLEYRRERRLSMRKKTMQKQLETLAGWGPAAAAESLEASIRNGWIGFFAPKESTNGSGGNRGKQTVAEHNAGAFDEVFGRRSGATDEGVL